MNGWVGMLGFSIVGDAVLNGYYTVYDRVANTVGYVALHTHTHTQQ